MHEQNRFFKWVYRLAGLGLLLGILGVIALVVIEIGRPFGRNDELVVAPAQGDAKPEPLRVGDIQRIHGTDIKVIPLREDRDGSKFSRRHYLGSGNRNLIFVRDGERKAQWLYRTNDQWLDYDQICECEDKAAPAVAILLKVRRGDRDGDGGIDEDARPVLALVRVDGTGYTELGGAVDAVLDRSLSDDRATLSLLVSNEGRLLYRDYDLATFKLRSEQMLASLQR